MASLFMTFSAARAAVRDGLGLKDIFYLTDCTLGEAFHKLKDESADLVVLECLLREGQHQGKVAGLRGKTDAISVEMLTKLIKHNGFSCPTFPSTSPSLQEIKEVVEKVNPGLEVRF